MWSFLFKTLFPIIFFKIFPNFFSLILPKMISFSHSSWLLPIKIYFFAVLLPILPIEMASNRSNVGYESLWNLNEMAECKLHYTALDYNNYGCWCGVGGSGEPMDGIDDCCMHHDKCYDAAVDNGICFDTEIEYVDNYDWACTDGEPMCPPSLAGCKAALCLCDKNVVDCWSKYPKPNDKAKCTHCNGGLLDRILAVMQSIGTFFASIPKAIANLFS